jgi:hypothetical protein
MILFSSLVVLASLRTRFRLRVPHFWPVLPEVGVYLAPLEDKKSPAPISHP